MKTDYKYKFSFVIPIYNVEEYLAETIESVLAQTMDFERNCEIVFVNDGSPDNSEEICLRYKQQFPKNIKYIKQANQGVSAARNRGIEEVEGEYVSFLDSDDKISPNTLSAVYKFFKGHYDEVDVVSIPVKFFDAKTGDHMLNGKFSSTRVIDIRNEYRSIQLHASSVFIKASALSPRFRFDSELKVGEDAKFITELILEKMKYGVVVGPLYYYRKRRTRNSAIDSSASNRDWYLATPNGFNGHLLDYAKSKFGEIPSYIQYVVAYELQWRFKLPEQLVLTDSEEERYKASLYKLLKRVEDRFVLLQEHIDLNTELFMLSKKYGKPLDKLLRSEGFKSYINDTLIYDLKKDSSNVHIEMLSLQQNTAVVEGFCLTPLVGGTKLQFLIDGKAYPVELATYPWRSSVFLGELISGHGCFRVELPVKFGSVLSAQIETNGAVHGLMLTFRRFSYLSRFNARSYRVLDEYIVTRRNNNFELRFEKYTPARRFLKEFIYMAALSRRTHITTAREQVHKLKNRDLQIRQPGNRPANVKVLLSDMFGLGAPLKGLFDNIYTITVRILYYTLKPWHRRPIWIISDRVTAAGDNGEALFRYIQEQGNQSIKVYFTMAKGSVGYGDLKKYGAVVDRNSLRYKLLFLYAAKIISSHADDFVVNPFKDKVFDFVDLYNFDFIFLQHGVIHNDLSVWLNRHSKNIGLFVTSAKPEYEDILQPKYGYDETVVKLTGLPRFDLLRNKPKQKLILAPTWRNYLVAGLNGRNGLRFYNADFKRSQYFAFYQKFMDNERVKEALKEKGMTAEFYLHPSLSAQIPDFRGSEVWEVKSVPYDYNTAFSEGNIMVTDYSSVAFDFAYLRKPVIYAQFDKEEFFTTHGWKPGYFSYEKNGFGPVVYDYESAVNAVAEYIRDGAVLQPDYLKKVEKFFYKFDTKNSERVYQAILNMRR